MQMTVYVHALLYTYVTTTITTTIVMCEQLS